MSIVATATAATAIALSWSCANEMRDKDSTIESVQDYKMVM